MFDFTVIMRLVGRSITAAVGWLGDMHVALPGVATAMIAAFVMYSAVRLLLVPFIGYGASDLVTRGERSDSSAARRKAEFERYYGKGGRGH